MPGFGYFDIMAQLFAFTRTVMKKLDDVSEALYPDHILELLSDYRYELNKAENISSRSHHLRVGEVQDENVTLRQCNMFVQLRTHYIFTKNIIMWTLVVLPLWIPHGMCRRQ
jgi:hypothetical protein